jgi:C4-dicarboxylate-specific signal transduction histidine kinase
LEVEPVDLNIFVHCRPIQISQVILNLLNNASDALEFSSVRWIRLQVKQVAATVYISVTDSGPGISLSIQSRLMQPFATTKAPGRGTGLGLSLSKQMIEEHDGTLFVDWKSEATRFVIQLPSPTGLETFRTPPSDN